MLSLNRECVYLSSNENFIIIKCVNLSSNENFIIIKYYSLKEFMATVISRKIISKNGLII